MSSRPGRWTVVLGGFIWVWLPGCEAKTVVEVVPVAEVAVAPLSVSLSVGAAQQLTASPRGTGGHALGGRTVSWSSSNASVATVSQAGVVTGMGAGTATITATSEGKSGSATVTVPTYAVNVGKAGTGSGRVTSSPSGIDCGTACQASFASGTVVTLTATAASGSLFASWGGACTGTSPTCQVTMSQARDLTATFTAAGESLGIGFGPEQFALIPAGTFQMGDMVGGGDPDELPVHTVIITKAFYMQKTEVTEGQWRAVMGTSPGYFADCGDTCPVQYVSWNDLQGFLTALNAMDPGKNYRLPTEAEWEYAARAGTTGDYGGAGVLDQMGWYSGNSGAKIHPVAQKTANAWGLFDMHGNVWEWVHDWYSSTYYQYCVDNGIVNDPPGPATGSGRAKRGGSWSIGPHGARSASRNGAVPFYLSTDGGFRLARTQ